MITSHYYKNTNNTPIMCDWEPGPDFEKSEKDELKKLIEKLPPEMVKKYLKQIKEELKKQKSCEKKNEIKKEEDKNSGLTN